jgi:hypothetical protein
VIVVGGPQLRCTDLLRQDKKYNCTEVASIPFYTKSTKQTTIDILHTVIGTAHEKVITNPVMSPITRYFNPNGQEISEANVPRLTLMSQNNGDMYLMGNTIGIEWTSNNPVQIPTVTLRLVPENTYCGINCTFNSIDIANTIPNNGNYMWTVPDVPPGKYLITINGQTQYTGLSPNGTTFQYVAGDSVDKSFMITYLFVSNGVDDFANCVTSTGAKFYGAFWCPHCAATKKMFGDAQGLLPYVECSTPDGTGQTQVCKDKNVNAYPTWIFADGSRLTGEISFEQIAEKTSCPVPQQQ